MHKSHTHKRYSHLPELGPMILAHRLASGPDPFSQILTGSSTSDLSWFCTIWSRPSLEEWNWIGCGKSDPAYTTRPNSGSTLATMAITKMLPNWIQHVYWEKDTLMSAKKQDPRGWGKPLGQLWHLTAFSTQSPTIHHRHKQETQVSYLVLWAQLTTQGYIRASRKLN